MSLKQRTWMRILSVFMVPGGLALFLVILGIVALIRERRQEREAADSTKARSETPA